MYYFHWRVNFSDQWQYGYREAVEYVKTRYDQYDHIIVTKSLGRPYIYFLLYTKFDPKLYWQSAQVARDRFFFLDVVGFDKFKFVGSADDISDVGKLLYVVAPGQLPEGSRKLTTINRLDNSTVFEIGEQTR